jgi:hypothetical protein
MYYKFALVCIIFFLVLIPGVHSSDEIGEITRFFPEERINAYSVGPDNVAVITGYVLREGTVEYIVEGGLPDPSINVFLTNSLAGHLELSIDPLPMVIEAVDAGEMKIQGVGLLNEIKVQGFLAALRLARPEKQVIPTNVPPNISLRGPLRDIGHTTDKGTYLIDHRSGLTQSNIEVSASEEFISSNFVSVKEYYGLLYNEAPQGVKRLSSQKGEEPLGTYLDIENLEGASWVLIQFRYNENTLYAKNMVEDKLKVKLYNEDSLDWAPLKVGNPLWVKEAGADKNNNVYRLNISHNSVLGVHGDIQPQKIAEKIIVKSAASGEIEVSTKSRNKSFLFYILTTLLIFLILAMAYFFKRKFKKK